MNKVVALLGLLGCLVSSLILSAEEDPNTYADNLPTIPKNARIAILPVGYDFAAVPQEIPVIQEEVISQLKSLGLTPFNIKFDPSTTPKDTIQLFTLVNTAHQEIRPAKQAFVANLGKQVNYDMVLIPAVVSRSAKLSGQYAIWDNVRAGLTIKGFGSGESFEWSGSRLALSLELDAYDARGQWLFTSYGGISIPYVINTREAMNDLKPRLFENKKDQDTLQKGVEVALKPFSKKIKISKEAGSVNSQASKQESINVESVDAEAQLNEGIRYYKGDGQARDYKQAIYWFTKSAEKGNATAQATLGYIYHKGEGVPQDHAQAINWYTKAAEQGNVNAQRNLAILYFNADGAPIDFNKALVWFTKAAEQGDLAAQFNLGLMNERGNGAAFPKDVKKAFSWYSKAASQGNISAQLNLAAMYARGDGVPQDNKQAYIWAAVAAAGGGNTRIRDYAASKLNPKALEEAQRETKILFDKIEVDKPKK
jgi:TPR repeat protein